MQSMLAQLRMRLHWASYAFPSKGRRIPQQLPGWNLLANPGLVLEKVNGQRSTRAGSAPDCLARGERRAQSCGSPTSGLRGQGYGSRLAHYEDIAPRAMDDLRADRSQQQTLEGVQPPAADHGEVGVLRYLDDDVAWVALRLDGLRLDPALG
jgi:hypothetical protein